MPDLDDARRTLLDVFGFPDFRPGQDRVVASLLAGRSALAVFPTGGGKSLCYQLPALLLDGLTVVVSPLIALMKDQVDALVRRGVAAARLDSTLDGAGARQVYDDIKANRLKLLYVAPERLAGGRLVETLARQRISLLAIDEAHCISEWGHNFRPEYLKLAGLSDRLRVGRVLALTATATPDVRLDIARSLAIDPGDVVVTGFRRANLELHATPCAADERLNLLNDRLTYYPPGSTVIYVTLQRTAEAVADALVSSGFDARPYHAGLADDLRAEVQNWFMASRAGVVVATVAFGMGIDKADVRYVYHYNLPKTLENYAQEVGRAGRDGLPSVCEVFALRRRRRDPRKLHLRGHPGRRRRLRPLERRPRSRPDVRRLSLRPLGRTRHPPAGGIDDPDVPGTGRRDRGDGSVLRRNQGPNAPSARRDRRPLRRPGADFLRRLFALGRKGTKWLTIDTLAAAETLNESRERILKALNYLEEQGEVVLQVSGLRQGYRRVAVPSDMGALVALLASRFLDREARDVARVRQVLDYARDPSCLTRRLLAYFGEDLSTPCGHCARCLGKKAAAPPPAPERTLGPRERALIGSIRAENHRALSGPRPLARFLTGLSSPATSRAKLTRHPSFGALDDVPFARVVAFVGG